MSLSNVHFNNAYIYNVSNFFKLSRGLAFFVFKGHLPFLEGRLSKYRPSSVFETIAFL